MLKRDKQRKHSRKKIIHIEGEKELICCHFQKPPQNKISLLLLTSSSFRTFFETLILQLGGIELLLFSIFFDRHFFFYLYLKHLTNDLSSLYAEISIEVK